jgi:hypothetical protein
MASRSLIKSVRIRGNKIPKVQGGLDGILEIYKEGKDIWMYAVSVINGGGLPNFLGLRFPKSEKENIDNLISIYLKNNDPTYKVIQDPYDPNNIPPQSVPPQPEPFQQTPPPPPPSKPPITERLKATGSFTKLNNGWKFTVYKTADNKIVIITDKNGDKIDPEYYYSLKEKDEDILYSTLDKINGKTPSKAKPLNTEPETDFNRWDN